MKQIQETKHCQLLLLEGSHGNSYHVYRFEKEKISIRRYRLIFWDGCKMVEASHETGHRFYVFLNERKARAVVGYREQEGVLDSQESTCRREILNGTFVLMWEEYDDEGAIYFLWIDCKDESCKNICLETYGYKPEGVLKLFDMIFSAMSHGISQMESVDLLCARVEP